MKKLKISKDYVYAGLFWSWNIIFAGFLLAGFVPFLLMDMFRAVQLGEMPIYYVLYGTVLTSIPILCMVLAATKLKERPYQQFVLGFAVEIPLMVLFVVRLFAIRQATPSLNLMLFLTAIGILTLLWHLLDVDIDKRPFSVQLIRLVGASCMLLVGVYISLWGLFYVLPLLYAVGEGIQGLFEAIWHAITHFNLKEFWDMLRSMEWQALFFIPFMFMAVLLWGYTATLFIFVPFVVIVNYTKSWIATMRAVSRNSLLPPVLASFAIITLSVFSVIMLNDQPQQAAFALLEQPPASIEAAHDLAEQDALIRDGLLNAFLASQRYLSAHGEVTHVRDMYTNTWDFDVETAVILQNMYESLLSPLLYQPIEEAENSGDFIRWTERALNREPDEAAVLYQQYFDQPITKGEQAMVVSAMKNSWDAEQARAGWQAVDEREIYLERQELAVTEHGDWAEVELMEVYSNRTTTNQEVVYYFTLPETAVITGLWLGESDDLDARIPHRVATRGAAQQVYQEQVVRRVDPALLEQIGPSQYRLRAFPVLPFPMEWDDYGRQISDEAPPMYMWLTYSVMQQDGAWPMPYLATHYNLFWDENTVRTLDGESLAGNDAWLPAQIEAKTAVSAQPHQTTFENGTAVTAMPLSAEELPPIDPDMRLAIILDRSRSMELLADDVQNALSTLSAWKNSSDIYLTASPARGESPTRISMGELQNEDLFYHGGQQGTDLLQQFNDLRDDAAYDAILVLTDGTGYESGASEVELPAPDAPVWMVHLGGQYSIGYDDTTLDLMLASGGGVVNSVEQALLRTTINQNIPNGIMTDYVDGYLWQVVDAEVENTLSRAFPDNPAFMPLAARQLILAEQQKYRGTIEDLDTLDYLHQLAVENDIVTPFSSMIVLINQQQQDRLDELENQDDRFDRELEGVGETDDNMLVTAVPEPEEWLLIFLVIAILIYSRRADIRRLRFFS